MKSKASRFTLFRFALLNGGGIICLGVLIGLLSCAPLKKTTPKDHKQPLETPGAEFVAEEDPNVEVRLGESSLKTFVETPAVEANFQHCCGNLEFKMEVDCQDQLRRCYTYESGKWTQTFGRRCKEELGEECYQRLCNEVCN